MAAILNLDILDSAILDSAILVLSSQTWLTLARIGSHHLHKKDLHSFILTQLDDGSHLEFYCCWIKEYFSHSFWLNLMMAAILNSTVVGLRKLHSIILTQLDDGNHLEFWPSWIRPPYLFLSNSLTLARIGSHHLHKKDYTHISLPTICPKNTLLIHSDSTWWWQPSWILPCWIQTPCFHSQIHSKTLSLHSDSDSN